MDLISAESSYFRVKNYEDLESLLEDAKSSLESYGSVAIEPQGTYGENYSSGVSARQAVRAIRDENRVAFTQALREFLKGERPVYQILSTHNIRMVSQDDDLVELQKV